MSEPVITEAAVSAALAVLSRVRIDMPDPMVLSDRQLVRNMLEAAAPSMVAGEPVTEHAVQYKSGDMKVRCDDPEVERIYPLEQWIPSEQRFGEKVWRRRIVVLEDWTEVPRG
jgi:hypothetical protein